MAGGVDRRLSNLDVLYNIEPESTPKYEENRGGSHLKKKNILLFQEIENMILRGERHIFIVTDRPPFRSKTRIVSRIMVAGLKKVFNAMNL